jgi:plastocyanin
MDGDFFFVIGIVLVIAAVAVALFGVRNSERFPSNRAALVGGTALFAAVVAATMAFAVVKSEDEQSHREAELAKEEGHTETGGGAGAPSESLDVSSPADGSLVFEPNGLEAKPGNLTINYDNPSPVPHSIAVATANGNVLGETQPGADEKQSLQVPDLKPGKYVFYCTVPGHREAGMEGDLTVTGGPTP